MILTLPRGALHAEFMSLFFAPPASRCGIFGKALGSAFKLVLPLEPTGAAPTCRYGYFGGTCRHFPNTVG